FTHADRDGEVDRLLTVGRRDIRELEADLFQILSLQGLGGELQIQGLDGLLPGIEALAAAVVGKLEGRLGPRVLENHRLPLAIDIEQLALEEPPRLVCR